jgi:hypothetical protein
MFRFISRVVVVSVFALSLNFVVVPAAEARPQGSGKAVPSATRSWTEQAMEWLNRILTKELKGSKQNLKRMKANDGGCIDPMGSPRLCY